MSEQENIVQMEKEPASSRLILTLGLAGFLSGLILVSVYMYTKPIIAANKAQELQEAIFEVLPGTDDYRSFILVNEKLKELEVSDGEGQERIYMGISADGKITGFAIPGAEPGYQDVISALSGYNADEEVIIGFKVLDSKETPGLGDKIIKDEEFQLNFSHLAVSPRIEAVKKGKKEHPYQVEAITGATISSEAIVRLLNKSMERWRMPVQEYLKTNHGEYSGK